jgi:hypothetical protein
MNDDNPSVFQILRGTHPYSMEPDTETAWCRLCLVIGLLLGVVIGGYVVNKIDNYKRRLEDLVHTG